jgi:TATA-box binding protein (TBP) (component of TFIID and TFIIIB)
MAEYAARKVSKNLRMAARRGQHPFEKRDGLIYGMRIVNIVGAHQMPHRVGIERIHELWRFKKMEGILAEDARLRLISKSIYDPTIFPALRCKIFINDGTSAVASTLVYTTGKIIVTGVQEVKQLEEIFNSLIPLLSQFPR